VVLVHLLITAALAADPLPLVTLGGGVVMGPGAPAPAPAATVAEPAPAAAPAPAPALAPMPGGWVPVLADCLEERAPQRFTVIDRASLGATVSQIRAHLGEVRALGPAWVVVTLGGAEMGEQKGLRAELEGFVAEVGVGRVVLVGLVPVTVDGAEPAVQASADARAARWNKLLDEVASRVAAQGAGVVHVDLWSQWPKDAAGRAALSTRSGALTDQGLARVAAAVCDVVLAKP
jgi:hypothetical protein